MKYRSFSIRPLFLTAMVIVQASGFVVLGCSGSGSDTPPTLIVLISLDTLRWDHVGKMIPWNDEKESLTPSLDLFAEDSIDFSPAVTPMAFTLPAHMTMFTGLHPVAHGVSDEASSLSERIETLPEILGEQGYRTVGVYSSEWLKAKFGFGRGFDQYWPVDGLTVGSQIRERVIKVLRQQVDSKDPLFLFLHYYDVHSDWAGGHNNRLPYFTPPDFGDSPLVDPESFCVESDCATSFLLRLNRTKQPLAEGEMEKLKELYAAGVEYLDFELGRVLNDLRLAGLYDDALIIITADHGEEFREHGMFLHDRTYEETLRVPLLIKFPGNRRGGLKADGLFDLSDLLPTILESAGVTGPEYIQGRSLGAAAAGFLPKSWRVVLGLEAGFGDRIVLSQNKLKRDIYTARSRRYKLLKSFSGKESEFYDLRSDPGEKRNLSAEQLPQQLALERHLDRLMRESQALAEELGELSVAEALLNEEEQERLRALGYMFQVEVTQEALREVEWGSPINFGVEGTAATYLGYGWSKPESQHNWSDGKEASFDFLIEPTDADLELELKLRPFLVPGKVDQQRIRISVGDHSIEELRLTESDLQVVRITIPNDTFEGSDLTVVLGLPDAENPLAINAGGDARKLAIAMVSMILGFK